MNRLLTDRELAERKEAVNKLVQLRKELSEVQRVENNHYMLNHYRQLQQYINQRVAYHNNLITKDEQWRARGSVTGDAQSES